MVYIKFIFIFGMKLCIFTMINFYLFSCKDNIKSEMHLTYDRVFSWKKHKKYKTSVAWLSFCKKDLELR